MEVEAPRSLNLPQTGCRSRARTMVGQALQGGLATFYTSCTMGLGRIPTSVFPQNLCIYDKAKNDKIML